MLSKRSRQEQMADDQALRDLRDLIGLMGLMGLIVVVRARMPWTVHQASVIM